MLLFVSAVLAITTCFVTWMVAYKMATPSAPQRYSRTVGWTAGFAGLPIAAASIICTLLAGGENFAIAMSAAIFIGMFIASPVGEAMGNHNKTTA